ncbi:hypothetical protein GOBAR_DD33500 [Gossypium barbadense]|nr:hypothetical protein GOBAR_DD33500 [Gossypium barbadense]
MDNKACNKVQPVGRKGKKKQVKDELDRIKQAEKKKRQLEKALATSAAIFGEDSDDSCTVMLNKEEGFNPWDYANNLNLFMGGGRGCFLQQGQANWGGQVSDAYKDGWEWAMLENSNWSLPYGAYGGDLQASCSYLEDGSWGNTGVSADLIAAQAVSALQITKDAAVDTIVLNGMLGGFNCCTCNPYSLVHGYDFMQHHFIVVIEQFRNINQTNRNEGTEFSSFYGFTQ